MNTVAIVAIVAMFFAFLCVGLTSGEDAHRTMDRLWVEGLLGVEGKTLSPAPEIILYISPPPAMVPLGLSLPNRNPMRSQ